MHTARLISEGTLELLVGPVVRFEFNFKVTKQITQTVHTTLMHTLYIHATRGIHAITVIRTRYRIGDRVENTAVHSRFVYQSSHESSLPVPRSHLSDCSAAPASQCHSHSRFCNHSPLPPGLRAPQGSAFARRKDRIKPYTLTQVVPMMSVAYAAATDMWHTRSPLGTSRVRRTRIDHHHAPSVVLQ